MMVHNHVYAKTNYKPEDFISRLTTILRK